MSEIEDELERLGLDPVWKGKYWVIHCPQHQDRHKSCICNERGWITCFAGCKPIHINRISNRHININYDNQPQEQSKKHTNDYTNIWIALRECQQMYSISMAGGSMAEQMCSYLTSTKARQEFRFTKLDTRRENGDLHLSKASLQ